MTGLIGGRAGRREAGRVDAVTWRWLALFLRLRPYALLAALGLFFFGRLVLHPAFTLYSPGSDLIAEHIPAKSFLVRSWRETGQLPLWWPDPFGGSPFVHDIQVAAFYPPHWILLCLPPGSVGPALSWLVAAHVILAGWCMYAYAHRRGLGRAGAMTAAIGYMFAGKWLFHLLDAGHYILIGIAWLPLFLLLLESAIRRGSVLRAAAAGAAFALIILCTHPQWTFYAALFAAAWALGAALESAGWLDGGGPRSGRRTAAALGRWLGLGLIAAVAAGALSAVQLLPTFEAASQSGRGPGVPPDDLGQEFNLAAYQLVGPSPVVGHRWEQRAGLGVLWLTAAALAPVLRRGRVRWQAGVLLAVWGVALGGGVLLQQGRWPGFGAFKIHSRVLILAAFPTAVLAGATTDALFEKGAWRRQTRILCSVLIVICTAAGLAALTAGGGMAVWEDAPLRYPWYAAALVVLVPAALLLLAVRLWRGSAAARPAAVALWVGLLLADLWAMAWPLVDVRDADGVYRPSACVRMILDRREADPSTVRWRVLDCCTDGSAGRSAPGRRMSARPAQRPGNGGRLQPPGRAPLPRLSAIRQRRPGADAAVGGGVRPSCFDAHAGVQQAAHRPARRALPASAARRGRPAGRPHVCRRTGLDSPRRGRRRTGLQLHARRRPTIASL